MEVDDLELLETVNDYQRRSDEPTFNTLDDIPEALMIEALDEANYIEDEINDYMMIEDPDTGEIIDYFGGLEDIKKKLLRTPLPPIVTFDDDPLRILRGIRFSITKRLRVSEDMWQAMKAYDYFDKMPVVSEERIREELTKCFKCNSSLTLGWLSELTDLRDYIFKNTNLWLKPTSEK